MWNMDFKHPTLHCKVSFVIMEEEDKDQRNKED